MVYESAYYNRSSFVLSVVPENSEESRWTLPRNCRTPGYNLRHQIRDFITADRIQRFELPDRLAFQVHCHNNLGEITWQSREGEGVLDEDNRPPGETKPLIFSILGMGSANERRRYIVTSSLIGQADAQNDPCLRESISPRAISPWWTIATYI